MLLLRTADPVRRNMVCCEVCDNLQEDCYEPNDRYLRHKEYTPSLQRVKTQGEAGCPFCALLYDAVKLFQYRWAAFQERDLYLRWTSFHRTDTERWLLRLDSVRRTRENSQWGPLWERPYICQIEVHSKPGKWALEFHMPYYISSLGIATGLAHQ